jgi:hypothetical protein
LQGHTEASRATCKGPSAQAVPLLPRASLGAEALATLTIAALNRQIDHLLDLRGCHANRADQRPAKPGTYMPHQDIPGAI